MTTSDENFPMVSGDSDTRGYFADECQCNERDSDCLTKCIDEGDVDGLEQECECVEGDKDCLYICLDNTDPCGDDRDCDDAREVIKDECKCYDTDTPCLAECIDDVFTKKSPDCFDQDYECLETYFQTTKPQISKDKRSNMNGAAGSLDGSPSFGLGIGLGSIGLLAMAVAVIYKKRQNNKKDTDDFTFE